MSKTGSAPAAPLTRKQASRVERERRQRQYILIAAGLVAVLVIGVILAGVVDLNVLRPRQPVARVESVNISKREFVKAAKFQRYQLIQQYLQLYQTLQYFGSDPQSSQYFQQQLQQVALQLNDPTSLGQGVIDSLVDDRLVRREAARRGITVSPAEVDEAYQANFDFYPAGTPTPTLTPTARPTEPTATVNPTIAPVLTARPTLTPTATLTPTETAASTATSTPGPSPTPTATDTPRPSATPVTTQGFATQVSQFQGNLEGETGMTQADIRYLVESSLYRKKLSEAMGQTVPTSAEQAHVRHILVADEALAASLEDKLRAGEDFAVLAAQYSTDESNKDQGGDLGWISRGDTVAEFEQAAFSQPVGEIGAPVKTTYGYHIIQVLERGDHPLSESKLASARSSALSDWLKAQRDATLPDGRKVVEVFDNWQTEVPTTPALPALQ